MRGVNLFIFINEKSITHCYMSWYTKVGIVIDVFDIIIFAFSHNLLALLLPCFRRLMLNLDHIFNLLQCNIIYSNIFVILKYNIKWMCELNELLIRLVILYSNSNTVFSQSYTDAATCTSTLNLYNLWFILFSYSFFYYNTHTINHIFSMVS